MVVINGIHEMMEHWREYAKEYVLDKYLQFHEEHPEIEINEQLVEAAKKAIAPNLNSPQMPILRWL